MGGVVPVTCNKLLGTSWASCRTKPPGAQPWGRDSAVPFLLLRSLLLKLVTVSAESALQFQGAGLVELVVVGATQEVESKATRALRSARHTGRGFLLN